MTKTRYELALDAAAVEQGIATFDVIKKEFPQWIGYTHTRASKIFAMGFAEWKEDNQFTRYNNEWTSIHEYYAGCIYTTEQLLNLYNQPA